MPILLKNKIGSIIKTLKNDNKMRLAASIEENWNKSALTYSKELNIWRPKEPMEKELLVAFSKELDRLGYKGLFKSEVLDSIKRRRILQTAPHLAVTESPRMLAINWLGSLAVPPDEFYIVGMFSGIPFSNKSRPGRINLKEDSINLFPSTMQDGLVYRSIIDEKMIKALGDTPEQIHRYLVKAKIGESYTKWALESCTHIERKILRKNNLVFFDINEVVTTYLLQVFKRPKHILYKIFFDPKVRAGFVSAFPGEIMFYTPVMYGRYENMESLHFHPNSLKSTNKIVPLDSPLVLTRELKEGRLCPGLLTTFLVLSFINEFKCFGSFAQVEYLPVYQDKLSKLASMAGYEIIKIPTSSLTTCTFPDKLNLFPADILMQEKVGKFKPKGTMRFGELLITMKDVLLESYFTGDNRKTKIVNK